MKVLDLLETNEWSNTEVTQNDYRKHLKKKQLSACHRFVVVGMQVGFYSPNIRTDVLNTIAELQATDCLHLLRNIKNEIKLVPNLNYSKLVKSCEDLIKVKRDYEQAGGEYTR